MTRSLRTRSERFVCQRYCLSRCRNTGFPAARWVKIHETRRRLSYTAAVAFDAAFARDVVLPLAEAAYKVMGGGSATLPSGYIQTRRHRKLFSGGELSRRRAIRTPGALCARWRP